MATQGSSRGSSDRSVLRLLLVGCLGVALLSVVSIAAITYRVVKQMARPAPPVSAAAIRKQFAGIPLYPGAQLDLQSTQTAARVEGAVGQMIPFGPNRPSSPMRLAMAVYSAPAAPSSIAAWYDRRMLADGWSVQGHNSGRARFGIAPAPESRVYQRGATMLTAMAMPVVRRAGSQLHLTLISMTLAGRKPVPPRPVRTP